MEDLVENTFHMEQLWDVFVQTRLVGKEGIILIKDPDKYFFKEGF